MTDYKKLVKALRNHASKESDCRSCKYYYYNIVKYDTCSSSLCAAAASAIEELQQIADHYEQTAKDYWKEACEYKAQLPKRGKWVAREVDIPGELHPTAFRCMCSMCRNEYVFPRIPQYCPDCGSMNTAKMEVQDGQ